MTPYLVIGVGIGLCGGGLRGCNEVALALTLLALSAFAQAARLMVAAK